MSETAFLPHLADLERLMNWLSEGECCSVIALSNMGKSMLLRRACDPAAQRRFLGTRSADLAFFYVDCNTMLTLSEQGFYEAALRSVLAEIKRLGAADAFVEHLHDLYHKIVEPSSPFLVPLSFNEAMVALSEKLGRRVVFLFDEFDDPFARLDGRVFLNLRALRDKYDKALCFVTATGQELCNQRKDVEASEFCELFTEYAIYLAGLNPDEARHVVRSIARAEGIELERDEIEFVIEQAGGHVGLLQAVTAVLIRVAAGVPASLRERSLTMARQQLDSDGPVRAECAKLWEQLTSEEQSALLRFLTGGQTLPLDPEMLTLVRKGVLTGGESPAVFGELFAGYARRQHLVRQPVRSGVYVDVESGDVWVDGKPVSVLTDHEYRLLLLLYGRINKIVTRDDVAESVWGADYMENIDDARCDKLLSRLRAKIESDPANPKYLQTVRGRGYKLVSG
ncbi:MAG: putative two-component response regulator [Chloroflexi bacterium]|nr:putative two-component response regulator [Chloroflexota bacterium]